MCVDLRDSGIDTIGNIEWGTHFSLFYRDNLELADFLTPYFSAGFNNNEYCLYITSGETSATRTTDSMRDPTQGFERYLRTGQFEIIHYAGLKATGNIFTRDDFFKAVRDRQQMAIKKGYMGVRIARDAPEDPDKALQDIVKNEESIEEMACDQKVIVACLYRLDNLEIDHIFDILKTHLFTVKKQQGKWEYIQDRKIREQKRKLNEIRETLEKAQKLAHIESWSIDIDTGKITITNGISKVFGISDENTTVDYHRLIPYLDQEYREYINRLISNSISNKKPFDAELKITMTDGEDHYIYIDAEPVIDKNDRTVKITGICQDITERKHVEEALRESEELFRRIVETAEEGIWVLDTADRISLVNFRLASMLGYSIEEMIGRSPMDFMEERYAISTMNRLRRRRFGVKECYVHKLQHRDGRRIWVYISSAPLFKNGAFDGIIDMVTDITSLKKIEDELRDSKAQAELYVDLMGHDINNMNQITIGYLELAHGIMLQEGRLDMSNISLLETAIDSLENSSKLIDNVRKLQREKMGLYRTEIIDVHKLLKEIADRFKHIPGRNIAVRNNIEEGLFVKANELLNDVFINLMVNAVKHSSGSIEIRINAYKVEEDSKRHVRIEIEDTGPGIPESLKRSLFDRLSLATTRARGKGFGLCLIKMLVDDYNGQFWVEDKIPGDHSKGTRFVVMIPALEPSTSG